MRLITLGILGLVIQGASLVTFITVSRSSFASQGKPIVIAAAFLTVALLLWRGVRSMGGVASLILLPAILALGYIAAFHLVGAIGFPGLLRDARSPTGGYLRSALRVTAVLFVLYGVGAVLLHVVNRMWDRGA